MNIEEEFFKAFGIKPQCIIDPLACPTSLDVMNACYKCQYAKFKEITAEKLLQLICLTGNTDYFLISNEGTPINIETLKQSVLITLTLYLKFHKNLRKQVKALFEDKEQ